jgi:thioredoxin-like negative regulator of GroEL
MAPVVHGLEQQYAGRIDFLYLNIADERNADAKRALGFVATPHFFFLRANGTPMDTMRGVVPADSVKRALDALLAGLPARSAR